jgi:putative nucleotidyltransferase with HDIG domain
MLRIMSARRKTLFVLGEFALLAVSVALAARFSRYQDWHPLDLLILLFVLSMIGDQLIIKIRGQSLSAAFIAFVLAMSLLGPASAIAISAAVALTDALLRRLSFTDWLNNQASSAAYLAAGGFLIRGLVGEVQHQVSVSTTRSVTVGLALFAVFLTTNVVNFVLVASHNRVYQGRSILAQARDLLVPLLPGQVAAAALAAVLAVAYVQLGFAVLVGAVVVILVFQYLAIALLRSEDRADQLSQRSTQLATLQLGVLSTLMETLNLRDPTTARHAAAVARYARDLAQEIGLDERDQDLAHTAGLLHDIGKFAFPDRILKAEQISSEDLAVVRRHPQDGAALVGRLDGYGPVSDIILYHHERIDGSGYPAGLIGREIPLLSQIVAICETYDILTARDSYRQPVTPRDAFAEMRRVASRQLDADLVERFVAMLERRGTVTSVPGDSADFGIELDFERRAQAIAQPSHTSPTEAASQAP